MSAQPLAKSVAADGKTEIVRIAGKPLLVSAVEFNRLHALNAELLEALGNVTTRLIAAHSLLQRGGKTAVASNTIFSMMLADYEKSFGVGRAAIAKAKGEES